MSDVPDQAVIRGVEEIVESNRKLDNAKPRESDQSAQLFQHRVDQLRPQLIGDLAKLVGVQFTKVFRAFNGVEERGTIADCHVNTFLQILLSDNLCRMVLE